MNFSLKTRLIGLSVAIVTAAMLTLAVANFWTIQKHVAATVSAEGRQLAALQARALGDWVETKRLLTHTLTLALDQADPKPVVQALRDGGEFSDAYAGFPDKSTIFLNPMPEGYDVTTRPWYQEALQAGKPIVTAPYLFTSPPEVGVTFAEPVGPAHSPRAVVGADVLLTNVARTVASIRPTPDSFAFLINQAGQVVVHPDAALTLQPVSAISKDLQPAFVSELRQAKRAMDANIQGSDYLLFGHAVPGTDWQLVIAIHQQQAYASLDALLKVSGVTVVVSLVIAAALLGMAIAHALKRLALVRDALEDIAQGEGDLTRRLSTEGGDELTQIAQAFNRFADKIVAVLQRIRDASESVRIASTEIASGTRDLSVRTEQQATALEETSAATEQLTATVQQNADNAQQASRLASGASDIANRGGAAVQEVVQTMEAIGQSSYKIADIINVINGIAFQTNILALNAAVEAARAGEQGRGFAVVAAEVRTLAQRSATAAKEIKELIDTSVQQVSQGNQLAHTAGATMQEIVDSVRQVTVIVAEISSASQQQSTGIAEIAGTVSQMDQATQQNAALVEEATGAAHALQTQAVALAQAIAGFQLEAQRTPAAQGAQAQSRHLVHAAAATAL